MSYATRVLIPGAAAFTCAAVLSAQQPKTLHGTVKDPLGALVPDATVELLERGKAVGSTHSDAQGRFEFSAARCTSCSVRVTAADFEPTTIRAASGEVDVTLATKTLTQQITVTANGTPTPEAQTATSVTVLAADEYRFAPEVQDPLRLVAGVQMTQLGEMGGQSGIRIRGSNTDAVKVLVDGVPANQIGGFTDFANIATVGIGPIEVLREPDSALYGADALAGVVSLTTSRGTTPLPLFTYAGDGGNFGTYRNEVTAGTAYKQFDLFSAFARIDTDNNLPNSQFHNATYAGNFGWMPGPSNSLRFTVRHATVAAGQPNSFDLYGVTEDAQQQEHDSFYSASWDNQTTGKWHNQIRYGGVRLNGVYNNFAPVGPTDGVGDYFGNTVTIRGANGYSVTGQAYLEYFADPTMATHYLTNTTRDFVYGQSDYKVTPHIGALAAFKYENESGASGNQGATLSTIQRGNYSYTMQVAGDVRNRLFYSLGSGLEDNGLFGFAATPRASLAYYLVRPGGSGALAGTKLHASFGKGIKEPSLFQQNSSLYAAFLSAGEPQLIATYGVSPLGAVYSRTYDGGVDQQLLNGRARLGLTYFHNEYTGVVEYVPQSGLLQLGIPAGNDPTVQYGAYINSGAFRSQGLELETEAKLGSHLFARAGYTYTDAVVQRSFSSDNQAPIYNTASSFPDIQIGAYSPLVGARPFRVAPHSGFFSLDYTRSKVVATLSGTLLGKRDDSTYLSDMNFGNSLLLPNRNLLGGYERLDLSVGYQASHRLNLYASAHNLLSEHFYEAFGYPALPFNFRTGIKFNYGGESFHTR